MYSIEQKNGHVVVYKDGEFAFTADTYAEAEREIDKLTSVEKGW